MTESFKLQFERENMLKNDKKVYALGFFDGVHLGHQVLLEECVALAHRLGAIPAAITFDRHPQSLFLPQPPRLISTVEDRLLLLRRYGMESVDVLPVEKNVMSTPWEHFLENLISSGATGFVCGDDFHFGDHGRGSWRTLEEFCRRRELGCTIVPEQSLDGIRISSSYIRRQIETGDMATAVRFLGHPYTLTGQVVRGQQLGRTLGIPTANIRLPESITPPRFGVYACRCLADGVWYPAVTNIGTRPTVSGRDVTVEPWILDYSGDLYGKQITLEFHRFLRPEQKFPDLNALRDQIRKNAEETRILLKESEITV